MIWLGVCYSGVTRSVIIENGTINHRRDIDEILPIALKDGKKLMDEEFVFQQDGATSHIHPILHQWTTRSGKNWVAR